MTAMSQLLEVLTLICPKCNCEMKRGTLNGRGDNFFLPEGEKAPKLTSNKILQLLPLVAMELFPACIAAHAFITKHPSGILGWEFSVVISGWIAGAILIGCVLAWLIYLFRHNEHS